ncbi:hypothetical protein CEXT_295451 [Caerostris extrusa]|uniref:Uncharacterized protein n=1 Tax=Caerostris extrusa TaxID=172846 RepID=A0AAV4RCQ9_CAEEX|nr:hypothetical protein CEXT_295451 [Caerostris extrusa]
MEKHLERIRSIYLASWRLSCKVEHSFPDHWTCWCFSKHVANFASRALELKFFLKLYKMEIHLERIRSIYLAHGREAFQFQ